MKQRRRKPSVNRWHWYRCRAGERRSTGHKAEAEAEAEAEAHGAARSIDKSSTYRKSKDKKQARPH